MNIHLSCVCYESHCFIIREKGYSIELPKSKYLKSTCAIYLTVVSSPRALHFSIFFCFVVITCLEPLTYNECISCCPVSCHQQSQCVGSELPCIDGCYCPDGNSFDSQICIIWFHLTFWSFSLRFTYLHGLARLRH